MQGRKLFSTIALVIWYVGVPLAGAYAFTAMVLNLQLVKASAAQLSYSLEMGAGEIRMLAGAAAAVISAYWPLARISRAYGWPLERKIMAALVWPFPVLLFGAVVLVELYRA